MRIVMTSVNVLLFTFITGMIISSILMPHEVFGFLHLPVGMFGRRLHMVSTAWGFCLMVVHLRVHGREQFERQHLGHIDSGVEIFESTSDVDITFELVMD